MTSFKRFFFFFVLVGVFFNAFILNAQNLDNTIEKIEYYKNGNVHFVRAYNGEIKHGPAKEFYENGKIKATVNYINDKRHGELKFFYENGNLNRSFVYDQGVLNGLASWYHENEKLKHELIYENGEPTSKGVRILKYYDDYTLKSETRNDSGDEVKLISGTEFYKNGVVAREAFRKYERQNKQWIKNCKEYTNKGKLVYEGETCRD